MKALAVEVIEGPDAGKRASSDRITIGTAPGNELLLTDPTVSRYHVELTRTGDRVQVVDHGSTNGTAIGGAIVERGAVPVGSVLALGNTKVRIDDAAVVTVDLHEAERFGGLVGRSPRMRALMARVAKVAKSDTSVLILGESGTGKEVIARAIHDHSSRARKPFVTVDCGALSPTLVASELFGHERGAFTGADRRHAGAFERANGGTVFLDEIGEMPPALQTALLGALERKRIRRVGGDEDIAIDVRVVAATNRDLRAEVNRGSFRLDLYYRMAVVLLEVPALRERPEDLPALVEHFVRETGHGGALEDLISPAAMQALEKHHWPGNVRELRNLVEATLAMGEVPRFESVEAAAAADPIARVLALDYKEARRAVLEDFEKRYLVALLARAKGNVSLAAREAQMDRSHLIDLLKRHALTGKD